MTCRSKEKLKKLKEDSFQTSEDANKILKNNFPVQLPKNVLRDLILSMDRGERRFVALKLKRYNKKGKDSSSVVKLYEILSRHASINKDEVETLHKYGEDIPHLEQVRQRLLKIILFALVEYRYFKNQKSIYVALSEIIELLGKKHIDAAKTLFRRLTTEYSATTNPFHKILIVEALTKILMESGPTIDKKDSHDELSQLFVYNFLEQALNDLYRYRKITHAINDLVKIISKESFPITKTLVSDIEQCVQEILVDFLEGGFSVREFQILYARLLYIAVLFKKFEIAEKLYEKIDNEFDLSNFKKHIEKKDIHIELALSLILWYSHLGMFESAIEIGTEITNFIKETLSASDFKPVYLLETYSRLIPMAWYTGNLDYAIDLVEEGEHILDIYGDIESYNKLAYFKVSKILLTIQSAVSYTAIGNFRFAKRLITSKDFKKEINQNKGMKLIGLLGSFIVFAEANEYQFLKETVIGLYENADIMANRDIMQELISILEHIYVLGDKSHLKQNLKKALQIATDLLRIDPLLYNAFYNSGFLHWLSGQVQLIPFKEALKNEKILFHST